MATIPQEELHQSLRRLYLDPLYTDLTIRSRTRTYPVHRVIVCPRSKFFDLQCRDSTGNPEPNGEHGPTESSAADIDLHDDDPHAVEMVVQYLYHLDYPRQPSDEDHTAPAYGSPKDEAVGDEDICESPTAQHMATEPKPGTPSVASQEDRDLQHKSSLVKTPPPKPAKKKKKRKPATANTQANDPEQPTDIFPDPAAPPPALEEEVENRRDDTPPAPASEHTLVSESHNGELVTHAKVFSLSQKYGIEALRGLALDKFKSQAAEGWDTQDFLAAAREVYHASMDESGDRRMREAVTDIVCQHPELLDKETTQNAIKDLQLNYDVLMRMRKNSRI